jgi:orotate phosphoribosyltransferase
VNQHPTTRAKLFEKIKGCLRTGKVVLSSGKETDFYFDGRTVSLDQEGAVLIAELVLDEILERPSVSAIGGPTSGADPIVSSAGVLAFQRGRKLGLFYVRKEVKGHGMRRRIEGPPIPDGAEVFLVDDVLTTGGSLLQAAATLREETRAKLRGVLVLIDREEGGRENLEKEGLEVVALFKRSEFSNPQGKRA